MLERLAERSQLQAIAQDAVLCAAAAGGAVSAHVLAADALERLAAAQQGMHELIESWLGWMQLLADELRSLQAWLEAPRDLLGVRVCVWPGMLRSGDTPTPKQRRAATSCCA